MLFLFLFLSWLLLLLRCCCRCSCFWSCSWWCSYYIFSLSFICTISIPPPPPYGSPVPPPSLSSAEERRAEEVMKRPEQRIPIKKLNNTFKLPTHAAPPPPVEWSSSPSPPASPCAPWTSRSMFIFRNKLFVGICGHLKFFIFLPVSFSPKAARWLRGPQPQAHLLPKCKNTTSYRIRDFFKVRN